MPFLLGVDGGGTGCRAAVADGEGQVLGEGRAGPANIVTDLEGARANILKAVEQAAAGTGARLDDLQAVLGLAGANLPVYAERLAATLPFATTRIESDAVIALKGAIGDADGVVATVGTGSVFTGQQGGEITQIGGWGFQLGDEASGAWLGHALLARALHAADGLAEMTPLLSTVIAEAGSPEALVDFARTAVPADYARYAPRLFDTRDAAAAAILAEADLWLSRAIDRLAAGADTPVTFLGGLGPAFARRLGPRYRGRIRPAQGTALDGALHLARQEALA
jgi:glucosamine kinase